ncbi:MAG: Txe/YoeB family addiction module toxin [Campylobacteraceae bacterium]|jgi:toxin YoeB|nr:Txe/YoeB family addiction module toxin [Campylobacteraceae bacterium]
MRVDFMPTAWNDYTYWQTQDKKTLKRINQLIESIVRNGHKSIGNPEPLKGNLSGWWSCRIDDKNRLIYKIENDTVEILQCKGHYEDK